MGAKYIKIDHDKYLHTLGNLSLTFNKSKLLDNAGFSTKKNLLSETSKINLNQQLLEYAIFDVKAITDRANRLLDSFIKEFAIPSYTNQEYLEQENANEVYISHKDIMAQGVLAEEGGLVIKKGSQAELHDSESFTESLRLMKKVLLEEGALIEKNNLLFFTKDTLFNSPSQAAMMITGASTNGRKSWKFVANNLTLKEVQDKTAETQSKKDLN